MGKSNWKPLYGVQLQIAFDMEPIYYNVSLLCDFPKDSHRAKSWLQKRFGDRLQACDIHVLDSQSGQTVDARIDGLMPSEFPIFSELGSPFGDLLEFDAEVSDG